MNKEEKYLKKSIILEYLAINNILSEDNKYTVIYEFDENSTNFIYDQIKSYLLLKEEKDLSDPEVRLKYKLAKLDQYIQTLTPTSILAGGILGRYLTYSKQHKLSGLLTILAGAVTGLSIYTVLKLVSIYLTTTQSKCYKYKKSDIKKYYKCELESYEALLKVVSKMYNNCSKKGNLASKVACEFKMQDLRARLIRKINKLKSKIK